MKTIHDLKDLLLHQLQSLYAAEKQISNAMPAIIEKAQHRSLKNALNHHLSLTESQLSRLNQIAQMLNKKVTLAGGEMNSGIRGLIEEANELFENELSKDVVDAAIIASVQKIEHYEITSYGTALNYASQLQLHKAEALLTETLNEEYDADDLLTALATASLNKAALPYGIIGNAPLGDDTHTQAGEHIGKAAKVSINERTVNSPGGRAGKSHRRYESGESRGH
jgi:ferritin-like metal-binding protein YciE